MTRKADARGWTRICGPKVFAVGAAAVACLIGPAHAGPEEWNDRLFQHYSQLCAEYADRKQDSAFLGCIAIEAEPEDTKAQIQDMVNEACQRIAKDCPGPLHARDVHMSKILMCSTTAARGCGDGREQEEVISGGSGPAPPRSSASSASRKTNYPLRCVAIQSVRKDLMGSTWWSNYPKPTHAVGCPSAFELVYADPKEGKPQSFTVEARVSCRDNDRGLYGDLGPCSFPTEGGPARPLAVIGEE